MKNIFLVSISAILLSACAGLPDQEYKAPIVEPQNTPIVNTANPYYSEIERVVSTTTRYPVQAMITHQQGRCVVRVTIARNGKMLAASLLKSSKSELLDDECIRVFTAHPQFPVIPDDISPGLDKVDFDVPEVFSIDKNSL